MQRRNLISWYTINNGLACVRRVTFSCWCPASQSENHCWNVMGFYTSYASHNVLVCITVAALKGERNCPCKMLFTPRTDSSHDDKHILWGIVYKSAKSVGHSITRERPTKARRGKEKKVLDVLRGRSRNEAWWIWRKQRQSIAFETLAEGWEDPR